MCQLDTHLCAFETKSLCAFDADPIILSNDSIHLPQPMPINICRWMVTLESIFISLTDLCKDINPFFFFHAVVCLKPKHLLHKLNLLSIYHFDHHHLRELITFMHNWLNLVNGKMIQLLTLSLTYYQ